MTFIVQVNGLSKSFGKQAALDGVSFRLEENKIYGLLGRNGAGKTTLMRILAAHEFAGAGIVNVFGEHPYENNDVLSRMCLIRENQKYPDTFSLDDVLAVAAEMWPQWDQTFAEFLVDAYGLPRGRKKIRSFSRGMQSAVGIVVGLASRAPLTIFDEPYLGLDATARALFYDKLLEDFGRHPRTVVLSTHLIDEVSNLLDHVLILDRGRLMMDVDSESLRTRALTVVGGKDPVAAFTEGMRVLNREALGDLVAVSALGDRELVRLRRAEHGDVEVRPMSLQQLFVRLTADTNSERQLIHS